jgi:predicted alpha/beta superfamily hydrolase
MGMWISLTSGIPATLLPQTMVLTRLRSDILNQERGLAVYLPSRYDSTKTYPVLYVLDGRSQGDHIARTFDSLSLAGLVPQTILVGIPNMSEKNRQLQLIPPYMKTDTATASPPGEADEFLSFMESELFPFIGNTYPASNVRLFAGNSRGGLLVMHSLLHKPEMFQARFCFSTPFWREDAILVAKVADFLRSRETLKTFLFMSAGEQGAERTCPGGVDLARSIYRERESSEQCSTFSLGWNPQMGRISEEITVM